MKKSNTLSAQEQAQKEAFDRIEVDDEGEKDEDDIKKMKLKEKIFIGITNIIKKVRSSIMLSSSILLGTFLIITECIILDYLIKETNDGRVTTKTAFYLAAFLFFFIPIFVLSGIPIITVTGTRAKGGAHWKKMFLVPIIGIIVPVLVMMPIARELIDNDSETVTLGRYLIFAIPASLLFWLTLSYLGMKKKRLKYGLAPFVFICFILPLVVL